MGIQPKFISSLSPWMFVLFKGTERRRALKLKESSFDDA